VNAGPEPPDHVAVEVIRQAAMRIAALAENGLTFSPSRECRELVSEPTATIGP
jgi:hypothetical protein